MLRDQNPGLLLRCDPKFAFKFADFSDSVLTIVAGEADQVHGGNAVASKAARSEMAGTMTSSGKLWQCASGAEADGQGEDATKHATVRRRGWSSGLHFVRHGSLF